MARKNFKQYVPVPIIDWLREQPKWIGYPIYYFLFALLWTYRESADLYRNAKRRVFGTKILRWANSEGGMDDCTWQYYKHADISINFRVNGEWLGEEELRKIPLFPLVDGISLCVPVEGSDVDVYERIEEEKFDPKAVGAIMQRLSDEAEFYWVRDNSQWYWVEKGDHMAVCREACGQFAWESRDGLTKADRRRVQQAISGDDGCREKLIVGDILVTRFVNDGIF
jgi:hypothetical protein